MIEARQRKLVRALWAEGRLSRWELHERTGLSPNGVGTAADALLRAGMVRECAPAPSGAGRPRVPLELDPSRRHVVGLALEPGRAEVCRVGLAGNPIGRPVIKQVADPARLVSTGAAMLSKTLNGQSLGVGVTVTGFVDVSERAILFSSALPGRPAATVEPVYTAAGDVPVVLENDMHALAARWLLTHRADQRQDVLLVWIADGRLGAAMLIEGRPNRGCATGANELGHSRYFVQTEQCFCGQTGCLERIVSSDFLARQDALGQNGNGTGPLVVEPGMLAQRAARFDAWGKDTSLDEILKYLSCSLANAVNFVRPHRLVVVSSLARNPALADALAMRTRSLVLAELADRVRIDYWDQAAAGSAETAAWLAMAELLYGGWHQAQTAAAI